MNYTLFEFSLIYIVFKINFFQRVSSACGTEDCELDEIYSKCLHSKQFTSEELENVRLYIQKRFASTYPLKSACKTLHVRKDIKCLSKQELSELIQVFKELYANGKMDAFSLIHGTFWPSIHKFIEVVPWHRWHINQLEKEMKKINPNVSLPYWEYITDFGAPESSIIWKTFGTSGKKDDNFCVTDGAFAKQEVKHPKPHCLKRQWNDKKIPVWEPPEWVTSLTQTSKTFPQFANLLGNSAHFKIHLHVGGYEGEMSSYFSTNDPIFYLFHAHVADYAVLKWQLIDDKNLLPITYNEGSKHDWLTDDISKADIENDFLTHYEETRVKEVFQVGYGDLCYIHDQLIKPINDMISGKPAKFPEAVDTLRSSLPKDILEKYFPAFASKTATFFHYFLPAVKDPFNDYKCDKIPAAPSYNSTKNGRRHLKAMRTEANIDVTPDVLLAEEKYLEFIEDINKSKYQYCSPYV